MSDLYLLSFLNKLKQTNLNPIKEMHYFDELLVYVQKSKVMFKFRQMCIFFPF